MSDGGKGSGRRPTFVDSGDYAANWSAVFGPSKLEQRAAQERALEELARINQELGLYDELELQNTAEPTTGT